jgi:hypothetical protein
MLGLSHRATQKFLTFILKENSVPRVLKLSFTVVINLFQVRLNSHEPANLAYSLSQP